MMHKMEDYGVKPVVMSFRHIRSKLGNPSWSDLMKKSKVARDQQKAGFEIYRERLTEASGYKDNDSYVFERCPLDIAGYSWAFKLPVIADEMVKESISLFKLLADNHKVVLIYRPVNQSFPYDRDDNARPSSHVRNRCDAYLHEAVFATNEAMEGNANFVYRRSVNQDSYEVQDILKLVT